MNDKEKPFYLKFPIFQIVYVLLWIPLGYIISSILSVVTIGIIYNILVEILKSLYTYAFELFLISGRMEAMVNSFYVITAFVFDLMILIIGLELVSFFLNKKKKEGGFDGQ
ncbi:MAG: hypothetical protein LUH05_08745 [Candidatus Gastranaerophilales bacterium]|nr:hypothetical protein [Candidatus Gastranaerophilales bacterium]